MTVALTQLVLSLYRGFVIGFTTSLLMFVSGDGSSSPVPLWVRISVYLVFLSLLLFVVVAEPDATDGSPLGLAFRPGLWSGIPGMICAGLVPVWVVSAIEAPVSWYFVILAVVLTVCSAVSHGFYPSLYLTAVALLAAVYAWLGPGWTVIAAGLPEVLAYVGVLAAAGILLLSASVLLPGDRTRLGAASMSVIAVAVVLSLVLSLGSYPQSFLAREKNRSAVSASAEQLLGNASRSAVPLVYTTRPLLESAADGGLAIYASEGLGRYSLWRRTLDGVWSRRSLDDRYSRADGVPLFLDDRPKEIGAEQASLWEQLGADLSRVGDRVGLVSDIAFLGNRVVGVSDTGLWDLDSEPPRLLIDPWPKAAWTRQIAVNDEGTVIVASQYLDGDSRRSELEVIDIVTGEARPVTLRSTGIGSVPVPTPDSVREGQWPIVGVTILSDGSFGTLIGDTVVSFSDVGWASGEFAMNNPGGTAWTAFTQAGDVIHLGTSSNRVAVLEMDGELVRGGDGPDHKISTGAGDADSTCQPEGATADQIPVGRITGRAGGPSTALVADGIGCVGGIWEHVADNASWVLQNEMVDAFNSRADEVVSHLGIAHAPRRLGDGVVVMSSAAAGLVDVGAKPGRRVGRAIDGDGSWWSYLREYRTFGGYRDRPWILAPVEGDRPDSNYGASLLVLDEGEWVRSGSFTSATSAVDFPGSEDVLVAGCDGLTVTAVSREKASNSPAGVSELLVGGQFTTHGDTGACVVASPVLDEVGLDQLGLVHAMSSDPDSGSSVLVAQSVLGRSGGWHHGLSRVSVSDGRVEEVSGWDLAGHDAVPVWVDAEGDRICAATIGADGPGPLFVSVGKVRREVVLPDGIVAGGCAWDFNRLIITDRNSGEVYAVKDAESEGFF
ncbi:hypothetical protein ABIE38_002169 [Dietzia sp. 2505]|uniref:hypothetical protein n=1 Tax=Dietzia sp. 2505 TaxID=3156457 RepID=UPI0033932E0E